MALLSDALLRHAAERPEVPWLFWAEGWDWRWLSWGEAARRVAGSPPLTSLADPLTPAGLLANLAGGSGGAWEEGSEAELRAAAEAVGRAVAPAGPPQGGREILVAGRPLAAPAERAVLAWAILAGAALLLEPDPAAFVATAAWARPTFFHGTAADIAALGRLAESARPPLFSRLLRRPPGLPFGRLRVVLNVGEDEVTPAGRALWERRGVHVTPLVVSPS